MSKLEMTIRTKLAVHQRMVEYHEAKDELYKMLFHEGIVNTLQELLKLVCGGVL